MTKPYLAIALSCREIIAVGFAISKMRVKWLKIDNTNHVHLLPIIKSHRIATVDSDTIYQWMRRVVVLSFLLSRSRHRRQLPMRDRRVSAFDWHTWRTNTVVVGDREIGDDSLRLQPFTFFWKAENFLILHHWQDVDALRCRCSVALFKKSRKLYGGGINPQVIDTMIVLSACVSRSST